MFKSVFAKYVTAFMVIITFGFALLLLIVTSIANNFAEQNKQMAFRNSAYVACRGLEAMMDENVTPEAFSDWVKTEQESAIKRFFNSVAAQNSYVELEIADAKGNLLYKLDREFDLFIYFSAGTLPTEVVDGAFAEGGYQSNVQSELSGRTCRSVAQLLRNSKGEICGIFVYSVEDERRDSDMSDLSKTVISSALLVLLAAMIAAYFITERTITPLREMSIAARRFADGKFDSRVIVRGKDEVAELSEAFNQMADSLENLEKMRSSFIANVSHDLRTPMTTIAGFIDSIRDGVIPPEEHDHYLEVVSIEVQRLSRLVASLLDLSRIQAGDRKFTMKPFDICEMARLILISFEKQIDEKRLDVRFLCDEERMTVMADHDAIYQIFYNICHNAVKFSREGGVLRISITAGKDKKLRVAVYNDGEGIPYEDQPMVFERFYKSDKSRGLDKSGVGLGLFIAKTIIAAHGERIGVVSTPGEGCEFFFTLTCASHNASHAQQES